MSSPELALASAVAVEEKKIHPVEFIQKASLAQEDALRMNRIRMTEGLGAAVFEGTTEASLVRVRRLGSLPASHVLYHSYRGDLMDMTPMDIYGLPEHNPNVQPSSRALVERDVYGHELTLETLRI
eukprot:gene4101-2947_t